MRRLHAAYVPVMRLALANRHADAGRHGGAAAGVRGVHCARLGLEFLPKLEEGNLWIRATMPTSMSLEAGDAR